MMSFFLLTHAIECLQFCTSLCVSRSLPPNKCRAHAPLLKLYSTCPRPVKTLFTYNSACYYNKRSPRSTTRATQRAACGSPTRTGTLEPRFGHT